MNILIEKAVEQSDLQEIYQKILNQERLTADDGIQLYQTNDILTLGALANIVRERINGNVATYVYNQHINYSNICLCLCKFCAFGKSKEQQGAFELSIHQIVEKVKERLNEPITEIHIVGSLHPEFPFSYYVDMIKAVKKTRPEVHVKVFTMAEIAHFAEISGQTIKKTLLDLKEAGLGSLPGGGAEVFSKRVRHKLCPDKLPGKRWLEIAQIAHDLGIKSNATMLYGHVETIEERVEHMLALREAQDKSKGFMTFIPLAFHSKNTEFSEIAATSAVDDLKTIAVSRLLLDNIPHIKAYWVMLGMKTAQVALSFGADDFDGTVVEEKITAMAGRESQNYLSKEQICGIITKAGREPVQRDTLYQAIA